MTDPANVKVMLMLIMLMSAFQQALALNSDRHPPYHSVYHVVKTTKECSLIDSSTKSPDVVCNTLQFFISNVPKYFTSNTTFYIAEGHHMLDTVGLQIVSVNDIHDLTLFGQGRGVTVIECGQNTKGFQFTYTDISIIGVEIVNCGQVERNTPTIRLYNSQSVALEQTGISDSHIGLIAESTLNVSVKNSSFTNITGYGIYISNACNVTVISTSFIDNDIGIQTQNTNTFLCFDPTTLVMNCSFEHNRDKAISFSSYIKTQLFQVTGSYFYLNGDFNPYDMSTPSTALFVTGSVMTSLYITECHFAKNLNRAVYVEVASLTLKQSIFKDNTVVADQFGGGGALATWNNNQLNITDCVFINNSVVKGYGGAIFQYIDTTTSFIYFSNLTLVNNTANCGGGLSLYTASDSNIRLHGLTLEGNRADKGGGLQLITKQNVQTDLVIIASHFQRNHATIGAAVALASIPDISFSSDNATQLFQVIGSYFYLNGDINHHGTNYSNIAALFVIGSVKTTSLYITECHFAKNLKRAVYSVEMASLTLKQSIFKDNTVVTDDQSGSGGALAAFSNVRLNISDCVFINNNAGGDGYGGAIYQYIDTTSFIHFSNLTLVNNTANHGGGLSLYTASDSINRLHIVLSGLTLEGNRADRGGGLQIVTRQNVQTDLMIIASHFQQNHAIFGAAVELATVTDNISFSSDIETQSFQVIGSYFYLNGDFNHRDTNYSNTAALLVKGPVNMTSLYITECHFAKNINRAVYVEMASLTLKQSIFKDNTIAADKYGGGGALAALNNIRLNISDCVFINNSVEKDGGAIYQYINTTSFIYFSNLTLVNNTAADYGGGLYLSTASDSAIIHLHIFLSGLTVEGNRAGSVGGLQLICGQNVQTNLLISASRFHGNIAMTTGGFSFINHLAASTITVRIDNCTFTDNEANKYGGGIEGISLGSIYETVSNCQVELIQTIITNNRGSGVYLVGCDMVFTNGHTLFSNNTTPVDGGGVYLDTGSHLNTMDNGSVSFINNTAGRYGGAIFSADSDTSLFHEKLFLDVVLSLQQCTLGINMTVKFIDNKAKVTGNNLYGGTFFNCDDYNLLLNGIPSFKNILECPNVPTVLKRKALGGAADYKESSSVSSEPLGVCHCNESTGINCTSDEVIEKVFPGQSLTIFIATVGLCGGVSPGDVAINKTLFPIATSIIETNSMSLCQQYNYVPEISQISDTNITTAIELSVPNTGLANQGTIVVQLTVLPCPLGLVLDPLVRECVCDSTLTTINGVSCNVSQPLPIQRSGNNWIAFKPDLNCTVVHDGCPFDYCISSAVQFKLNESNPQCNHHRAGTLCGECLPGLSVQLGGNQCADCSSISSIYITLVFLIAGILLVFLILVLNLTVSIGTINGVLFYANVVQLNSSEFGLQGGSVPVIDQFISWINLDLGIQTCFINGLDDYWKVWLQFLFPLYIWVIVIGIILAYHYSTGLSKYCNINPPVPVLATLILMSYTKLLRTLTAIFTYTRVVCGELEWIAWARDGNVEYARGKHVPLFIVGIVFSMLALVYTGLVFSAQWLVRYSGVCCRSTRDPVVKLKPFIDAYTGPYKVKYRFWVGLGLIARLVFTVSFSLTAGSSSNVNNVLIVLVVLSMSLFHNRVYQSRVLYVLEMLSFLNLFILALTTAGTVTKSLTVTIASVSFEIILFIAVILIHLYQALTRKWPKLKNINKLNLLKKKSSETSNDTDSPTCRHRSTNYTELDEYDYGEVVNRRESIIFSVD